MITWPYVAGFWEADGWLTVWTPRQGRKRWVVGITQHQRHETAMQSLARWLQARHVGLQIGRRLSRGSINGTTPMVNIMIGARAAIVTFLASVQPSLLIRQTAVADCLAELRDRLEKDPRERPRPKSSGNQPWHQKAIHQLVELQQQGYSNKAIAIRMGRTVPSVARKLSRLGLRRANA